MSCCNYLLGFDKSSIYLDNWRGKKQVFLTAWQDPWSLLFKGKSLLSWARPSPIKSWEFSAKFVFSCWHQAWPGLSVLTFWHFCLCRGEGWGWEAGLEGERGEERRDRTLVSVPSRPGHQPGPTSTSVSTIGHFISDWLVTPTTVTCRHL